MSAPTTSRRARTWTLRECADETGLSVKSMLALVHSGELPAKWCGNHYRVLDSALEAWLEGFGDARDGVT